ncbi:MAG: peptidase domain-containing ABC transporter [Saprospiraceae bacterium]|jgi:ATP-binding cassette subfamily B protein|nr:peptidase domain-containing ABC transporter [Saprospiraceae bacterium]
MLKKFPFFQQMDAMDCGPTCLRMIAQHYGRHYTLQTLRDKCYIDREGVSLLGTSEGAESIGLRSLAIKIPFEGAESDGASFLMQDLPLPCVVHWDQNHFVVVYKKSKKHIWIADPGKHRIKMTHNEFKKHWVSDGNQGVCLLLEPTPEFYTHDNEEITKSGFGFLFRFMKPYRRLIIQLGIGLILGSIFQLIFPFLTQAIVDTGIKNQDIDFIWLILIGQLILFVSQISVQFIQSWILLHIGARVNVSLISDFLIKLMKLPISYFDIKMIGDLLQRINDHNRIEQFLTSSTLNIVFSLFNMLVFGAILWYYDTNIFLIFLGTSIAYVLWIVLFLKKRKAVDYIAFKERADNQSTLIELIQGMQEIKLQNSEKKRRWQWVNIQARLFRANIKSLAITQTQDAGANFFSQLKDILVTVVAAKAVIEGSMTLGQMLAVQYIIGQLNGPLQQFIIFIRTAQDAKISLERLGEIHSMENEEEEEQVSSANILPEQGDLHFENVNFQYNKLSEIVLKNMNLTIPRGKVTAIVGTSGSGKTTLVKLILGFYEPTNGTIRIGGIRIDNLPKKLWRKKCGAVMQDGYVFSDTIANNVAESEDYVDKNKLLKAVKVANIQDFIENMPLGYNTMVGAKGNGLSQGQKQRLLIARAVYKNPEFLFFDEATNALDAQNERIIVKNLDDFYKGRTVIVVAHRLSTVKDADQIIVLEKGELVEKGTHEELTAKRGAYFHLVKNQLELGA